MPCTITANAQPQNTTFSNCSNCNSTIMLMILSLCHWHCKRQSVYVIDVIWRRQDAGLGVDFVSPKLLQLDVLRHHQRSDEPAAVCSECGCTFGVGGSTLWSHNAGATGAALASGSASGGLQDGHSGLLVTVRYGSILPGCQLSAGLRRRSSSAAFCQLKDMCRQKDLQQLWRQMLCCCRSKAVEQSASSSETNWH